MIEYPYDKMKLYVESSGKVKNVYFSEKIFKIALGLSNYSTHAQNEYRQTKN